MTPRSSRTRWGPLPGLATGLLLAVGLSGCATQKYVRDELGRKRAESVMHYLHDEHRFPLHRMNVISYGPRRPDADNATREGRAQNRRVTLVVLS